MSAPSAAAAEEAIAFSRPSMGEAEAAAAAEAVRSGWIVGGPRLAQFEQRFAAACGAKHAVGVSSWTTGASLVLHAWGVGTGDEVLVPSLTFIATVNVIRHVGAQPVFVDVDPLTYTIDVADAARKVTPRTKAIMPVDQLGMPCDIDAVNALAREHGLHVLDDAACAIGSCNAGRPVGSLAEVAVFSLHARKVVTTAEGGMIVTDDAAFAERLRMLRHQGMSLSDFARHGMRPTEFEQYPEIGFNYRITDVQAAIGLCQMDRLPEFLASRRASAERYTDALEHHPLIRPPHVPHELQPNWQSYQVVCRVPGAAARNAVMDRLFEAGIPTRRGVMASHREAPYAPLRAQLPVTEALADSTLQLPMHSDLTAPQQTRIVEALRALV